MPPPPVPLPQATHGVASKGNLSLGERQEHGESPSVAQVYRIEAAMGSSTKIRWHSWLYIYMYS